MTDRYFENKRAPAMVGAAVRIKPESKPARIKGIVFDCDGVLFDSKQANTAYYNHIRFAMHLPPMTEEEATYSHMVSTDEALEKMVPGELKAEAFRIRKSIKYRDNFMPLMQPAPHMPQFLRSMKEAGLPLALCTNRSDSVYDVLGHFAIKEYFSPIITISHAMPKPSPQGLLQIMDIWRTTADSIVFLGDSLVDQQAAAAAGVPFWSYDNPQLQAEMHVSGFKELEEFLRLMLME